MTYNDKIPSTVRGHARRRWRQQEGKCFICNKPLDDTTNKDHFIAKSRGGRSGWSNMVLVHRSCNERKGNILPSRRETRRFVRMTQYTWPYRHPVLKKHLVARNGD